MPSATPNEVLLLKQAFATALQAAAPAACLPPALEAYPRQPALVLGTGKAAASMTAAFCARWDAPTRGLVVTRYGHGLKAGETCGGVEIVEAGHPSPDASSLAAGARLLELAASARDDEYLICLISGGGSSLAAAADAPGHVRAKARGRELLDSSRRGHPRDQLRAQAFVEAEGRPARGRSAPVARDRRS